MQFFALATDFDDTLATEGRVSESTWASIQNLKRSGRRLLLVTGRETDDLLSFLPQQQIFDRIITENGAVMFDPATSTVKNLAEPAPPEFLAALQSHGVSPLSSGRVIVSTREPWQDVVIETIRELGLELQVIFNKGSVMVLPSGVNKATGLRCALEEIGLSTHNIVAAGDAENDHAFLTACGCGFAVANALPSLKERADWVTSGDRGCGVQEIIDMLLRDDLREVRPRLTRNDLTIGKDSEDRDVQLPAFGATILVAGRSGGGKSTLTTTLLEALVKGDYQFCAVDPEGDYQSFPHAVVTGDAKRSPAVYEVLSVLERPGRSVIVNLLGLSLDDRPIFFAELQEKLSGLRERTGRPQWLIVDEAHHVMPAANGRITSLENSLLITLEPECLPTDVLRRVTHAIAVGAAPAQTISQFCSLVGTSSPDVPERDLPKGDALLWSYGEDAVRLVHVLEPSAPRVRHSRKYASAELTPDRSFYFRGPENKLNLRAPNLITFVRLLEGVDDDTWILHLRNGEYSAWFRDNIKNEELAEQAASVEENQALSPQESREAIKRTIEERYTI